MKNRIKLHTKNTLKTKLDIWEGTLSLHNGLWAMEGACIYSWEEWDHVMIIECPHHHKEQLYHAIAEVASIFCLTTTLGEFSNLFVMGHYLG